MVDDTSDRGGAEGATKKKQYSRFIKTMLSFRPNFNEFTILWCYQCKLSTEWPNANGCLGCDDTYVGSEGPQCSDNERCADGNQLKLLSSFHYGNINDVTSNDSILF